MEIAPNFLSLWNALGDFDLPPEPSEDTSCIFAQKFSAWTKELCATATQRPTIVSLNQAKVLLLDKYFEWRSIVPKHHRNRTGRLGHECIFQVFERAYGNLRAVELSLTPPMLFVPAPPIAPPPPPPAPPIPGIYIGELDKP